MSGKNLWEKEIAGVKPLRGGKPVARAVKIKKPAQPGPAAPAFPFEPGALPNQQRFDPGLYEKIAKGRVPLDARIDLHDLTEDGAYRLLEARVTALHAVGRRRVLVITGKGRSGAGRMKTALPRWLSAPRFLPLVSSFAEAAPKHGGAGAFYVLLRKPRGPA